MENHAQDKKKNVPNASETWDPPENIFYPERDFFSNRNGQSNNILTETVAKIVSPKHDFDHQLLESFQKKKMLEDENIPSLLDVDENEAKTSLAHDRKKRETLIFPQMKTLDRIIKTNNLLTNFSSSGHIKNRKSNFFESNVIVNQIKEATVPKKSFYDVITNFYLTKRFISLLQRSAWTSKLKYVSKAQFDLINDPCFFYSAYQEIENCLKKKKAGRSHSMMNMNVIGIKNTIFRKPQKYFENWALNFPVFHPFAKSILFWDSINFILFSFMFILAPIQLGFEIDIFDEMHNSLRPLLTFIMAGLSLGDIISSFNTGYYKKGVLILKRREIIKKYMKRTFWFDILSLVAIIYRLGGIHHFFNFSEQLSNILFLLYFVKFYKVRKNINKIEELLVIDQNYFNAFSLCQLVLRLIIVGHVAACIWHFIAFQAIEQENNITTWLSAKSLVDEDWTTRYLYSFYYILITMNTVGYGDITPQNPTEVLFCVLFVFVACIMFGYCINCVGTIFQDFYKRGSEFKKDLFTMNDFMKSQNIPKELQIRIRKYLEHLWKEEKIHNVEMVKNVWNKLSDSLKYELLFEINGPIIKKIDLFCQNFSEKTLRELIKIMKEERYTPGDIIFNQGEKENKDIFLIKKGCVQIFVENNLKEDEEVKILKELKVGELFGEIAFFSDQARSASAKSKDFTTLIRIDQQKFKTLIEQDDIDREKFNHIKDSIRLYNDYDGIYLKCYGCHLNGHLVLNCPKIHRIFLKDICILKYNSSTPHSRAKFTRRRKKDCHHFILEPQKDFFIKQFFNDPLLDERDSENDNASDSEGEAFPVHPGTLEAISPTLKETENLGSEFMKSSMKDDRNFGSLPLKTKKEKEAPKKRTKSIHFAEEEKSEFRTSEFRTDTKIKNFRRREELHQKLNIFECKRSNLKRK